MISVYSICYRNLPNTIESLESIVNTASQPLDITVVESESRPSIATYLAEKVADKTISRAMLFKNNVRGVGLKKAIELFPPKGDFFILTDLDVVVPSGADWLGEIIRARQEGNIMTGFPLNPVNYVPPNGGHSDNGFGCWLMGVDTNVYINTYPKHWNIVDGKLIQQHMFYGKVKRINEISLYHLGWDLWKTDESYFAQKVREQGAVPQFVWEVPDLEFKLIE